MALTARQQLFVTEYAVDHNGTQAAIRAGFSRKGARVAASRLLTKAPIKAALANIGDAPTRTKNGKIVGRPRLPIDPKVVEGMAAVGAMDTEIADFCGCDEGTIRKRFSVLLTKARSGLRLRLRQAQVKAALAGDRTMLVWLGKTMLGQKETTVTEMRDVSKLTDEELAAERKKLGLS